MRLQDDQDVAEGRDAGGISKVSRPISSTTEGVYGPPHRIDHHNLPLRPIDDRHRSIAAERRRGWMLQRIELEEQRRRVIGSPARPCATSANDRPRVMSGMAAESITVEVRVAGRGDRRQPIVQSSSDARAADRTWCRARGKKLRWRVTLISHTEMRDRQPQITSCNPVATRVTVECRPSLVAFLTLVLPGPNSPRRDVGTPPQLRSGVDGRHPVPGRGAATPPSHVGLSGPTTAPPKYGSC